MDKDLDLDLDLDKDLDLDLDLDKDLDLDLYNSKMYFCVGDYKISYNCNSNNKDCLKCCHKMKHNNEIIYRDALGCDIYYILKHENLHHPHFDKYEEYYKKEQELIEDYYLKKYGKMPVFYAVHSFPQMTLLQRFNKCIDCIVNLFINEEQTKTEKLNWIEIDKKKEELKKITDKYKASSRLEKLKINVNSRNRP